MSERHRRENVWRAAAAAPETPAAYVSPVVRLSRRIPFDSIPQMSFQTQQMIAIGYRRPAGDNPRVCSRRDPPA